MRAILLCSAIALMGCYAEGPIGGEAVVYGEARPPEPPPLRAEVVPASPSTTAVWAAGHWAFSPDGYVWTPGEWVTRPRPGAEWVAAHWDERGHHFIWVGGHWR